MENEIERILKSENSPIKSFANIQLSKNDLVLISDLIKKEEYSKVHFINWGENKKLLDENADLKEKIYLHFAEKMVKNDNMNTEGCEIDSQFETFLLLEQFSDIEEFEKIMNSDEMKEFIHNTSYRPAYKNRQPKKSYKGWHKKQF